MWNMEVSQQPTPPNPDTFTEPDWASPSVQLNADHDSDTPVSNSVEVLEQQTMTASAEVYEVYAKPIVKQTAPGAPITMPESHTDTDHPEWPSHVMQDDFFFDTRLMISLPASHESDPSLCFPRYCSPVSFSDKLVMNLIEEGRRELQRGHFESQTVPSLKRLLSDPPFDCLSFRLLQFISKYGAVPLQNLLFTFWVQYLFLRVRELANSSQDSLADSGM
jgi:hypothetical protein